MRSCLIFCIQKKCLYLRSGGFIHEVGIRWAYTSGELIHEVRA